MKLWIARNDGGTLELHQKKPSVSKVTDKPVWVSDGFAGFIFNDLFPEVTFENSPMEVELNINQITTQEDKELLLKDLKDLSARLPYGVKVNC